MGRGTTARSGADQRNLGEVREGQRTIGEVRDV